MNEIISRVRELFNKLLCFLHCKETPTRGAIIPNIMATPMENQIWKSQENKFLKVLDGVVLTRTTDFAVSLLDKHFGEFNYERYVTSALRTPTHQLQVIIDYAKQYNIPVDFTADDVNVQLVGTETYVWTEVWSQLLVKGLIINPPFICACLYDHKNSQGITVPAGTVYRQTPHVTGDCFDMSGWRGNQAENQKDNVNDEATVIKVARDIDPVIGIVRWVIERKNNCLHVEIKHIEG